MVDKTLWYETRTCFELLGLREWGSVTLVPPVSWPSRNQVVSIQSGAFPATHEELKWFYETKLFTQLNSSQSHSLIHMHRTSPSEDSQDIMGAQDNPAVRDTAVNGSSEKTSMEAKHIEETVTQEGNLVYDGEEEPEIHMRTWIALASMFLLNLVQVFALQGPPAVVSGLQLQSDQPLMLCSSHTLGRALMVL